MPQCHRTDWSNRCHRTDWSNRSTGATGATGLIGATGATGLIGATGATGPAASQTSAGADLYTTEINLNITGSLLTNLPDDQVTIYGGFEYIAQNGSLIVPNNGFYLLTYGAASMNVAPICLSNTKHFSVLPGSTIMISANKELISRTTIKKMHAGDKIALSCPYAPGIILGAPSSHGSDSPITAFFTISFLRDLE